ncbi:hypothetical protein Hanom_Chr17g01574661 [Helianthus anomalus]
MNSLNFIQIFHMFLSQVTFSNYGMAGVGEPLEIRVPSGRSPSSSLSFNCLRCTMKILVQSRQL